MTWEVEYSDEFFGWWGSLIVAERRAVSNYVLRLVQRGPNLPFPYSSKINASRHSHMRELRVQSHGDPIRVFYAFDPARTAILLIGGAKTVNDRFYLEMVPIADRLYDEHVAELKKEEGEMK